MVRETQGPSFWTKMNNKLNCISSEQLAIAHKRESGDWDFGGIDTGKPKYLK